ncbi:MAG: hypothetical protein ACTSR8_11835 [Promethearchaeota archaeon]
MLKTSEDNKTIKYDKTSKRFSIELLDFTYIAHYDRTTKLSKVIDDFHKSLNNNLIGKDVLAILDEKELKPIDLSNSINSLNFSKTSYIIGFTIKSRFINKSEITDFELAYPYNTQISKILEDLEQKYELKLDDCSISVPIKNKIINHHNFSSVQLDNRLDYFIKEYGHYIKLTSVYEIPYEINEHIDLARHYSNSHKFEKAIKEYDLALKLSEKEDLLEVSKKIKKFIAQTKELLKEYKTTPPGQAFPPEYEGKKSIFLELKDQMVDLHNKFKSIFVINKEQLHAPKAHLEEEPVVTEEMVDELIKLKGKGELIKGPPSPPSEPPTKSLLPPPGAPVRGKAPRPSAGATPKAPSMPPSGRPAAGGTIHGSELKSAMLDKLKSLKKLKEGGTPPFIKTSESSQSQQLITYDINLGMQYYSVMMAGQNYLFYIYFSHKELHIEVEEDKEVYETTFTITTTRDEPPMFKIRIKGKGFKVHPFSGKVVVEKEDNEPSLVIFSIKPKKIKRAKSKEEERRNLHIYVEFEKKIVSHTILSLIVQPKHFSLDLGPLHFNIGKNTAMLVSFIPLLITTISAIYTIVNFDFSATSSSSTPIDTLSDFIPGIGSLIFFATFIITILKKGVFPIKQKWSSFVKFDNSSSIMK